MFFLFAGAALARPCQLDLQVVFLNAKEAATHSAPVAERVYATIVYERMQPPKAEAGLEALVNTGRGAKCPATS